MPPAKATINTAVMPSATAVALWFSSGTRRATAKTKKPTLMAKAHRLSAAGRSRARVMPISLGN